MTEGVSVESGADVIQEQYDHVLGRILTELDKVKPTDLITGPCYLLKNKSGESFIALSLVVDHWNTYDFIGWRKFFLLAFDDQWQLKGHSGTVVSDTFLEKDGYVGAWGDTFIRDPGTGLCIPVNLARIDLLARISGERIGARVSLSVGNYNLQELITREEQLAASNDRLLAEYVNVLRAQQERWQHVYGSKGVLGFDSVGTLSIQPLADCHNWHKIDLIELKRVDQEVGGRKLVTGEVVNIQPRVGDQLSGKDWYVSVLRPKLVYYD